MLSLMSYEHVRRSVSLIIRLVSVSFGEFRSLRVAYTGLGLWLNTGSQTLKQATVAWLVS